MGDQFNIIADSYDANAVIVALVATMHSIFNDRDVDTNRAINDFNAQLVIVQEKCERVRLSADEIIDDSGDCKDIVTVLMETSNKFMSLDPVPSDINENGLSSHLNDIYPFVTDNATLFDSAHSELCELVSQSDDSDG